MALKRRSIGLTKHNSFSPLHPTARDKRASTYPSDEGSEHYRTSNNSRLRARNEGVVVDSFSKREFEEDDIFAPPKSSSDEDNEVNVNGPGSRENVQLSNEASRPNKRPRIDRKVRVPRNGHWNKNDSTIKQETQEDHGSGFRNIHLVPTVEGAEDMVFSSQPAPNAYGKRGKKRTYATREFRVPGGREAASRLDAATVRKAKQRVDDQRSQRPKFREIPKISIPAQQPISFKEPTKVTLQARPTFRTNNRLAAVSNALNTDSVFPNMEALTAVNSSDGFTPNSTASSQPNSFRFPSPPFDTIASSTSTTSPVASKSMQTDSPSSLQSDSPLASLCPVCLGPVPVDSLQELRDLLRNVPTRKRFSHQEHFCRNHRIASAESARSKGGYPTIDFSTLPTRLKHFKPFIRSLLTNPTKVESHYRDRLAKSLEARRKAKAGRGGLAEEMAQETGGNGGEDEDVGYYGSKGGRIILEWVMKHFSRELKAARGEEAVVAAGGISAYVQGVAVPELVCRLVIEDERQRTKEIGVKPGEKRIKCESSLSESGTARGSDISKEQAAAARAVMAETAPLGRLLAVDEDDEVRGDDDND